MSDKYIGEKWVAIGGSSTKIHREVPVMVVNRSLTLVDCAHRYEGGFAKKNHHNFAYVYCTVKKRM